MKDNNCAYCAQGELVAKSGYPVCAMDTGYLYIFKEWSKPRCVTLVYRDRVSEMIDISDGEWSASFADVAKVARAIHEIYKPDKVNYGAYGDTGCHFHMHIIPRYNGGNGRGSTFQMNPDKVYLTDDKHEVMAEQIRAVL